MVAQDRAWPTRLSVNLSCMFGPDKQCKSFSAYGAYPQIALAVTTFKLLAFVELASRKAFIISYEWVRRHHQYPMYSESKITSKTLWKAGPIVTHDRRTEITIHLAASDADNGMQKPVSGLPGTARRMTCRRDLCVRRSSSSVLNALLKRGDR